MSEQSDTPSWWRCDTHGPGTRAAWGCPECVRELRTSLSTATHEIEEARAEVEKLRTLRAACLRWVEARKQQTLTRVPNFTHVEQVMLASEGIRAALAQPEATAADLRVYDAIAANYANPLRDEWRLASEPPEDDRDVALFIKVGTASRFISGYYEGGHWWSHSRPSPGFSLNSDAITHWRDIEPPEQEGNDGT